LLRAMLELALAMLNRVNIPQILCHKPLLAIVSTMIVL
jgi:hypothetical protein